MNMTVTYFVNSLEFPLYTKRRKNTKKNNKIEKVFIIYTFVDNSHMLNYILTSKEMYY